MRDLYVVFEEGRAIKCVFHTIVVRNGALAEKYPGGLRAFTEKNLSKSNRDLTVYCDMGSDIGDVWGDLVDHGLTPGEDFICFDATSHTMAMEMGGKDNAEEAIEFTVPWLEGRCTKEGVFVWLSGLTALHQRQSQQRERSHHLITASIMPIPRSSSARWSARR